jgi:hypothetical protein
MRYRAFVLAVAFLVAACSSENSTSPTPTPTPTPTPQRYTLSGTVTDKSTAAPLSSATITVTDGPNAGRSATTDSAGRYTFADLQSSRFTIRVTRDGYGETTDNVMLNANIMVNVALERLLTGSWGGTVSFMFNGQRTTSGLSSAQLTQTGNQLTGVLTADGGVSGSLNGTADGGRFAGTLRIDFNPRCSGIAEVTGPATSTTITLTSPVLSLENCTGNVRDIELRLTR